MKISIRYWRNFTLLILSLFAVSAIAEEIEEVVVTGSYIKRSTADSPSPLSVINREELDAIGAMELKDVVNTMTYQSGNIANNNVYSGGDNGTGNSNINLRNLGMGSTLVLINSKRSAPASTDNSGNGYVDLSNLIPGIALERVEVVKDGSSALYGSDAIAGVVNFITRNSFEGAEIQVDWATDDATGNQDDLLVSGIMGMAGDRGHMMVSASYLDRKPLQYIDRLDDYGNSGISTFGQPGRFIPLGAPVSNPNPLNPAGSSSYGAGADLDCALAIDGSGAGTLGTNSSGSICYYDFSSFFPLVAEQTQAKLFGSGEYELSDSMRVYGEYGFSFNRYYRQNSLFPDVTFAIVPTDSPGLINDANRRGVMPVPLLALQRMMGGNINTPLADRPVDTQTRTERDSYRYQLGTNIDFGGSWAGDFSVTSSVTRAVSRTRSDTITSKTNLAFVGLGGPGCNAQTGTAGSGNVGAGSCYFYNPFASSRYKPDGSPQDDISLVNPDELLQWMAGEIMSIYEYRQVVYDGVITGDLMEMGAGTLQLAVGFQRREDEAFLDGDKTSNDNDFKFILGFQDYEGKLTTNAVFVELAIPLADNLDIQLAARYEDFKEIGESTADPKITALWRPTDSLTLRASAGTSFRVGSILQLFGSSTALLNTSDPFSGTGGLAFRPTITEGNSDLVPEEAFVWNIGVSWAPVDGALAGFSVDFDYFNVSYEDLLTREGHQDLVNKDNASRCPNGRNTDAAAGPLCGAIDSDGDGITEIHSIGPGLPDKVIRRSDGLFTRTEASYLNAQELESSGIDLTLAYQMSTERMGDWRFNWTTSYTLDYDLTDPDGGKVDGVGSRNASNSIGHTLPEFRTNLSVFWNMDRHSAVLLARHVDGYEDDLPQSATRGQFIGLHPTIDSYTTIDVAYTYSLPEMGFMQDGSAFTFGIKNATDEGPPKMNTDGGYDAFSGASPVGRIYYARYKMAL